MELEAYREEKSSRRVERKTVNTTSKREQKQESKINFLRKFYPEVSKSPGGKTLRLIHTHSKSELSVHPSDIVQGNRLEELPFSPQAKRKAGGGEHLSELYSPSKRTKFRSNLKFFENGGLSEVAKPIWRLSEGTEQATTELVGKLWNK